VRGPDGVWFMFYTGGTNTPAGVKQRIGVATSADLSTWHRHPASPVAECNPAGMSCSARDGTRRGVTRGCSLTRVGMAGTC